MSATIHQFNLAALSPTERMELADWLYDSAVEELETAQATLSPEQLAEIDRRLAALESGAMTTTPWQDVNRKLVSA